MDLIAIKTKQLKTIFSEVLNPVIIRTLNDSPCKQHKGMEICSARPRTKKALCQKRQVSEPCDTSPPIAKKGLRKKQMEFLQEPEKV